MRHGSEHQSTRLISADPVPELAVQRYSLEIVHGPQTGQSWTLKDKLRVGKGADNDVVIVDATVSRNHLVIDFGPSGLRMRDLGSTNGTFIDSTRVVEAFIYPGMQFRVGEVQLRIRADHESLPLEPAGADRFGELRGQSAAMRRIFALLGRIAPTDATILIQGETGTGKGAVARAIHDASNRADKPFVTVDCGAISRSLIESELFGHERGAFTGATQQRRGALETCAGGTLFIDELDDMPLDVQPKLLRALDEREIHRLGSSKPIKLDLRVIGASKKNLRHEVQQGRFREDLFFRLSVVSMTLPALRERLEDVPLLADGFLEGHGSSWGSLAAELRSKLKEYTFPGNVRELRNILERVIYLGDAAGLDPLTFPSELRGNAAQGGDGRLATDYLKPFKVAKEALVERFEREYLTRLLRRHQGRIAPAAREAEIDRKYLYMLLEKHGIHEAKD